MRGLDGKAAFVTGAGSGIGRACALRLAEEGATIAAVDIRKDAAEETAKTIEAAGGTAVGVECDVASGTAVAAAVERTVQALGGLNVIVNAAGILAAEGDVVACSEDDWDRVMAINVKSMYLTGKHGVPAILAAGGGAIVNIASVFGFTALPDECAYDASKGAVLNLTRHMAVQYATSGIRVNAICPSDCDTPLLNALLSEGDVEAEKAKLAEPIPMGRLAKPEEIASGVAFLSSADAGFVTGVALPVDGGFLAR
ncbi:SDR family NAD(P)-dependent oxidoreductase [Sciscionella sediminilitoris]|uniref:SDR family NAD(P)-dependent oxidoreductase n=1 Tax=Sciscionella sediminilitoris TaxID=1445613 RepID=UPI0004DEDA12|nr:SDR family oxidoreductase [Sciscionella sp. SE31]